MVAVASTGGDPLHQSVMSKKAATAKSEEAIGIEEIFGPGGLLEKRHSAYEFRRSQLEMAKIVEEDAEKSPDIEAQEKDGRFSRRAEDQSFAAIKSRTLG